MINKDQNRFSKKPSIKENKIEAYKLELKEKYDEYFAKLPAKSKLEEKKNKEEKKPIKEGFMSSPAVFTRTGMVQNAKVSSLFSGSVEDIINKLGKLTEKKTDSLFTSKVKKEAQLALSNIVSKELTSKNPDMKLVEKATSAIKTFSKDSLKEQTEEEKAKEDEKKKADEEEKAKEKKEENLESESDSKQLSESIMFKHNSMLDSIK